ncbi:triphosphoribosyl-dephospho-CoA synthase [Lactobacillus colini]|uniref:Probable 2-(5''-triphosphoribosyl)-3'-dephosphocoenzyme-A synthase n=2 Tax=Lactobacillus colini TaxID=1819254 RepID=A0ABS4MDJ2_9LACO|nr:triphosphoribosyl-dephospho-CoA synthase CitG [Lactobacillus colini]MBP2057762.1 triphosphoribosyl-dephospho-CoA synthase [Lactobacillus colini]
MTKAIVDHALRALLYEVVTNPKPGLVDPVDAGSHLDMDVFTFINSSLALEDYLNYACELGESFTESDLTIMFNLLRQAGLNAEKAMLKATNNVNTHKGAVFSLGIFVCAQSYAKKNHQNIYQVIKKMCNNLVKKDLSQKKVNETAGERQYKRYGLGGVRQLAQDGYPVVEKVAYPFLIQATGNLNERFLDTLIVLALNTQDSTFIKRAGGIDKLPWLKEVCEHYLDLGGSKMPAGFAYLRKLNKIFKENNYSLGGCADLLILTIFMALENNEL